MQELIAHIGLPKTGTSSLQRYLAENSEGLARKGLLYPKTGRRGIAHHELAFACRRVFLGRGEFKRLRAVFFGEVAQHPRAIVSSEALDNIKGYAGLVQFFGLPGKRRLFKVRTVCYLREFLDLAASSYAQKVQNSALAADLEMFCAQQFRAPLGFKTAFWEWFSEEVAFSFFERKRLVGEDIVADFFSKVGAELPAPAGVRDANPSISGNLLSFKLLLNAHGLHSRKLYRAFLELAGEDEAYRGRFRIPDERASALRCKFEGYNREVSRRTGDFPFKSFADGIPLFDIARWDSDVERFLGHPALMEARENAKFRGMVSDTRAVNSFASRFGLVG